MLDITMVGPIVTVLAILDVIIHLKLDLSKIQRTNDAVFTEPSTSIPSTTMTAVVITSDRTNFDCATVRYSSN